ncbi:MAG: hypothetical protein MI864_01410 [Pseudomonadales bacterium]|nr:hypothetical protein [Pseudomonadales bacterium]
MRNFKLRLSELCSRFRIALTFVLAGMIWIIMGLLSWQIFPYYPIDSGNLSATHARPYLAKSLRWLCATPAVQERLFVVGASNARVFRPAYLASEQAGIEYHLIQIPGVDFQELDLIFSQLIGCLDVERDAQTTIVLMTFPWLFHHRSQLLESTLYPRVLEELNYNTKMQNNTHSMLQGDYDRLILFARAPLQLYDTMAVKARVLGSKLSGGLAGMFQAGGERQGLKKENRTAEERLIEQNFGTFTLSHDGLRNNHQLTRLIALIKAAQRKGVRVMILQSPYSATFDERVPGLERVRTEFRSLVQEQGIAVLEFADQVKRDEFMADGIHPKVSVSQLWSRRLIEALDWHH